MWNNWQQWKIFWFQKNKSILKQSHTMKTKNKNEGFCGKTRIKFFIFSRVFFVVWFLEYIFVEFGDFDRWYINATYRKSEGDSTLLCAPDKCSNNIHQHHHHQHCRSDFDLLLLLVRCWIFLEHFWWFSLYIYIFLHICIMTGR